MIGSTTMRVSGLASGMDTEEIVNSLVQAQSSRLIKLQQSKTQTTWKSDAYRDVNKQVDEFRKAMEGLRLQSTFNKQTVSSSDSRITVSSGGASTRASMVISEAKPATAATPATVSFGNGSGTGVGNADTTFKLNDVEISLKAGQSLGEAISEINLNSGKTGVLAHNVGGSLVLTSLKTGDNAKITISESTANGLGIADKEVTGKNAQAGSVIINDAEIKISTNKFTYEGVTIQINDRIPQGSRVSLDISQDTESVASTIKNFVEKYNELIEGLNDKLVEKKFRDFPPLTDDQKKDMSEKEIELWEEKAKSGLLSGDSTIRNFLNEMRLSLTVSVNGTGALKNLSDIGITYSNDYRDNGKLILNEDQLKSALTTKLEDVKLLFTGKETGETANSSTVNDKGMHDNSGFAWRMYDRLNLTISQLGAVAGSPKSSVDTQSYLAKQLENIDSGITREQSKMEKYESRLWAKFTAMEKAISQLNSQSAWLYQQTGG